MLLLAPTTFELERILGISISDPLASTAVAFGTRRVTACVCGFGLAAAAARTASLLATRAGERCILIGLAGSFASERLAPGTALLATEVHCHGIGAGEGANWLAPSAMGLPQIEASGAGEAIHEHLALAPPPALSRARRGPLLSVAACSADSAEAERRSALYPTALAEDMESFAVALACRLAGCELIVLRAISNLVGERDRRRWHTAEALAELSLCLTEVLETG